MLVAVLEQKPECSPGFLGGPCGVDKTDNYSLELPPTGEAVSVLGLEERERWIQNGEGSGVLDSFWEEMGKDHGQTSIDVGVFIH